MELDELIKLMKEKMSRWDLSDGYLSGKGLPNRKELGVGEHEYGVTMVPCSWVYNYLVELQNMREDGDN